MRDDLFTVPEVGAGSEEMLLKALEAGYGVDAAQYEGGRALIPEDCETTLVNAMREQQEDFKLMNTLKKTPVKSTVHQFGMRTNVGDEDNGFVGEGGAAPEDSQDIARKFKEMKYIQKYREITEQMRVVDTFENAEASETLAGTISVLKTAEKYCFHGDSAVVPKQFDGLIAQVNKTEFAKRNIKDLRGKTIQAAGERVFTDMAMQISDRGGEANKVFYPLILGQDIQDLCKDRLRYTTDDERMAAVFKDYPTIYGTLRIAADAGPDKLFRPRHIVTPGGDPNNLPNAPTVTAAADSASGSLFLANDAGNFLYKVHAVNEYGVSEGASPAAAVAVAAGDAVTLTITPNALKPGTGFIICRSSKGGGADTIMEMARVGRDTQNATTVVVDKNDDLPGTADMLFITEKKLQTVAEFFQLLPLRKYRMPPPSNRLVTPFIMALWGTPALKVPEWCGVVKNIQYAGGIQY
ncbi:MAG: hypothetical protein LBK73_08840 [Treponema sp.]|jgi:hypothetical protein|nr:hypothetical protein [Treponema sp.]